MSSILIARAINIITKNKFANNTKESLILIRAIISPAAQSVKTVEATFKCEDLRVKKFMQR